MTNPVSASALVHIRALKAVAGVPITYVKSDDTEVNLVAVPGRTEFDQVNALSGTIDSYESRDYLMELTDLGFVPGNGDYIKEEDGLKRQILRSPGGRWFKYSDHYKQVIRVYTKQIESNVQDN